MDAVKLDERQVHIEVVDIRMNKDFNRRGVLISFLDEMNPNYRKCTEEYFKEFSPKVIEKINSKTILFFLREYGLSYVVKKIINIGGYIYQGKVIEICDKPKQPTYFCFNNAMYMLKDI